jgi:hypothetical protein
MVRLVDIAPALECVDVQDSSANVHGIWAKRLAGLLGRHPELRMIMTGKEVGTGEFLAMVTTPSQRSSRRNVVMRAVSDLIVVHVGRPYFLEVSVRTYESPEQKEFKKVRSIEDVQGM